MDDHHFDALSRALIAPGSRRLALRTLLGTLLGAALLGPPADDLAAAPRKKANDRSRRSPDRNGSGHDRAAGEDPSRQRHGTTQRRQSNPDDRSTGAAEQDAARPESNEVASSEVGPASHGCKHAGTACTRPGQCCTGKCLSNDTCSCNATNPCPQPRNRCKKAVCSSGRCIIQNKAKGVRCTDGMSCTTGDACDGNGRCVGTPRHARCPSTNPCRSGRCRPSDPTRDTNGCILEPISGGPTITCGIGECQRSVQQCLDGQEQTCVPGEPSEEICDGKDNNCDGVVDGPDSCTDGKVCVDGACKECHPGDSRNCYTGPDGTAGVGICQRGTETCNANGNWGGSCQGEVTPASDVCDGLDNNCDGVVDGPDSCTGGKNCVNGHCICPNNQHDCGGTCVINASAETCGARCTPCPAPPANATASCDGVNCGFTCNAGFHRCGNFCRSDTDIFACGPNCVSCPSTAGGQPTCTNGTCGITCNTDLTRCGNFCDRIGDSCNTGQPGTCATGTIQCVNNTQPRCVRSQEPQPETCNGLDDDCDGVVDNGFNVGQPCGFFTSCTRVCDGPNATRCPCS